MVSDPDESTSVVDAADTEDVTADMRRTRPRIERVRWPVMVVRLMLGWCVDC